MAHDYIDIGESHLRLDDFTIWTLRHFFCETLSVSSPESLGTDARTMEDLLNSIQAWQWLGPGIISGGDFNTFASSEARLRVVKRMLIATQERVAKFGSTIPLDYLEEHINSQMAYYLDEQPVERFASPIDQLISFIPGHF